MMITQTQYQKWSIIIRITGDVDEFTGERP
jgi:hypothetical protein